MDLQTVINWRYGTKRMTGQKVPENDLNQILEAIRLAPSSRGLQPYKVLLLKARNLSVKFNPLQMDSHKLWSVHICWYSLLKQVQAKKNWNNTFGTWLQSEIFQPKN